MIVMMNVKFFIAPNNLQGDIMKIFNLLLVMIIANLSFADDHGNPSSVAGAGLPEGGFSTFHVFSFLF